MFAYVYKAKTKEEKSNNNRQSKLVKEILYFGHGCKLSFFCDFMVVKRNGVQNFYTLPAIDDMRQGPKKWILTTQMSFSVLKVDFFVLPIIHY